MAFKCLVYMLPAPPNRSLKRPRMSKEASLDILFCDFEVCFIHYIVNQLFINPLTLCQYCRDIKWKIISTYILHLIRKKCICTSKIFLRRIICIVCLKKKISTLRVGFSICLIIQVILSFLICTNYKHVITKVETILLLNGHFRIYLTDSL